MWPVLATAREHALAGMAPRNTRGARLLRAPGECSGRRARSRGAWCSVGCCGREATGAEAARAVRLTVGHSLFVEV
jgi:hypothetical protein